MEIKTGKPALPVGRYFKYAIGEIVLVVIGILIALSINNWNEQHKNNRLEVDTLSYLKEDLVSSLDQLNKKIKSTRKRMVFDSLVLIALNERKPEIDKDSLNFLVTKYFAPPTFDPEPGMLIEIIRTGKLNIIRRKEIRSFITSWNMNISEIKELENALHDNFNLQKEPYFYNHFSYRNTVSSLGKTNLNWEIRSVRNEIKFENIIVKSWDIHRALLYRQKKFRDKIMEIIEIIDVEIKA